MAAASSATATASASGAGEPIPYMQLSREEQLDRSFGTVAKIEAGLRKYIDMSFKKCVCTEAGLVQLVGRLLSRHPEASTASIRMDRGAQLKCEDCRKSNTNRCGFPCDDYRQTVQLMIDYLMYGCICKLKWYRDAGHTDEAEPFRYAIRHVPLQRVMKFWCPTVEYQSGLRTLQFFNRPQKNVMRTYLSVAWQATVAGDALTELIEKIEGELSEEFDTRHELDAGYERFWTWLEDDIDLKLDHAQRSMLGRDILFVSEETVKSLVDRPYVVRLVFQTAMTREELPINDMKRLFGLLPNTDTPITSYFKTATSVVDTKSDTAAATPSPPKKAKIDTPTLATTVIQHSGSKRKDAPKDEKTPSNATVLGESVILLKQTMTDLTSSVNRMAGAAVLDDVASIEAACRQLNKMAQMLKGFDPTDANEEVFYITAKGVYETQGWCVYWRCTLATRELERWLEFQLKLREDDTHDEDTSGFNVCGRAKRSAFMDINWNGHVSAPMGALTVKEVTNLCSLEELKGGIRGYCDDPWNAPESDGTSPYEDEFNENTMLDLFTAPTRTPTAAKASAAAK